MEDEYEDMIDVLHKAERRQRARIKTELLEAIGGFTGEFTGTHDHDGSSFAVNVFHEDDFRAALDRICPE